MWRLLECPVLRVWSREREREVWRCLRRSLVALVVLPLVRLEGDFPSLCRRWDLREVWARPFVSEV